MAWNVWKFPQVLERGKKAFEDTEQLKLPWKRMMG